MIGESVSEEVLETPNKHLSIQVIEELAEQRLIPSDRKNTILQKFVAGKVTSSDWRLWAEQIVKEEVKIAEATQQLQDT